MKLNKWGVIIGLVTLMLLFYILFYAAPAESGFGGIDSTVTDILEENGVEPWSRPIAPLAGSEVESGLFAMQAALSSEIMFYCLNHTTGRREAEKEVGGSASAED